MALFENAVNVSEIFVMVVKQKDEPTMSFQLDLRLCIGKKQ